MAEQASIVVTSIFEPNDSLRELARGAARNNWEFIIIGDSKSPENFFLKDAQFFDLDSQSRLDFRLAKVCPINHYSRKNLGYLLAIRNRNTLIIETDDDNIPFESFWDSRKKFLNPSTVWGKGWFNVYSLYCERPVWPRGLPLENVMGNADIEINDTETEAFFSPIQQGLADRNPDVDAVFRMTQPLPLNFTKRGKPIRLSRGLWSPFNSQNTTWFKEAFPLLYLPSYCSFRMTDIWRSFVAQRIAWECNWELTFHDATVYQERNEHNLLRDFEQEIPGYLFNNRIKKLLEDAPLLSGIENIAANLRECYKVLIKEKMIDSRQEMKLLDAWLLDMEKSW